MSADSRQVYRDLDIGTGKITHAEMRGIPHYCIDIADPEDEYAVTEYVQVAQAAIADIVSRGKVPIVVGGTGFYIDVLLGRRGVNNTKPDAKLRQRLSALPLSELQKELQKLDIARYASIDHSNPRRLMRAIEIAKNPEVSPRDIKVEPCYNVLWIGLTMGREELKTRIVERLRIRLAAGMLDEARALHERGLSYKRMESLGLEYRYMARHLQGLLTYDEMVKELELRIYQYAKRQMTWFKKNPDIEWIDIA